MVFLYSGTCGQRFWVGTKTIVADSEYTGFTTPVDAKAAILLKDTGDEQGVLPGDVEDRVTKQVIKCVHEFP